ncbi:MAG: alcohol dehydrogenase catalytic domain-containing protein [Chloroflexi bacterium]|nr:alcohol dehydrogenase catalytic domain-containing protein [Chloroflexota bacterium]
MIAAKLYGARDLRVEEVLSPPDPKAGEALVRIGAVGVCGSDLHTYEDGRIGDTVVQEPLVLGHEFAGIVTAVGPDARDGMHHPLKVGQRVAVDPAVPCWHCDKCEGGDPNLCRNLGFMGLWPDDGGLQEYLVCPARNCFPILDDFSMDAGALLEPLGVAIHAVDLGKIKVANRVAVLGCGPIGLLIMRLAKLSGARPIFAFDQFDWRLAAARQWGADETIHISDGNQVEVLMKRTNGRGVDVVFEAAWAGDAVGQAVQMADLGGRVVMVGIPGDDQANFVHSTARRKGLTLVLSRRMKHTYPRAISLVSGGSVNLGDLVTHHFSLEQVGEAFALNAAYEDNVIKVMIQVSKDLL